MFESTHGVSPVEARSALTWPGPERPAPSPPVARIVRPRNGLLGALPAEVVEHLRPYVELVALKKRQILHERNVPVAYAYFIERGTASLLSRVEGRNGIEVGTLGHGDFVGVPVILGTGRTPHRCVVQSPGEAFRIRAEDLQCAMDELPELRRLLFSYVQALMVQSAQLVVCNTRHSVRERLARWLLVARDRTHGNEIEVTHQSLSRALGVRRAGVTTAMGRMEEAGLIRRGRGRLFIVDRDGLEKEACECYQAIQAEHQRIACHRLSEPPIGPEPKWLRPAGDPDGRFACRAPGAAIASTNDPLPNLRVSLKDELEKLGPDLQNALGDDENGLDIRVEAEPVELPPDKMIPLALIVHELVLSAAEQTSPADELPGCRGIVIACARSGARRAVLSISRGASAALQTSSVSSCRDRSMRLARTFAAQVGGEIRTESSASGTRFLLEFPI